MVAVITPKAKKFNKLLLSAKDAMDSVNIPFHLHFGTALGAHRERSIIQHDNDLDIAVFYKNVNKIGQVKSIIQAMEKQGFELVGKYGKLATDLELQFEKNKIGFDIFWIYEGTYRSKKYFLYYTRFGMCDDLPNKRCVWGIRPYKTIKIDFLGTVYNVIPTKTLVDMYGDWKTPKKYNYFQGLELGAFKGLLTDYSKPRPTNAKVAFCFLLYDTHKHSDIWVKFFNGDNFPIKNYSIYTHLKSISDKTPKWISENKIKGIKTGWCEENLVLAWIKLLQKAMENPDNKYFILLSGECIPLFTFAQTYKKIVSSNKSRINIDANSNATADTGLLYADQWVLLTRKHAKLLIDLATTPQGKQFMKQIKQQICTKVTCYCPDEIYPINWFVHKYGQKTSTKFKSQFRLVKTTYTYWDGKQPHPIKFNTKTMEKKRKTICTSGALFARKFNSRAGRQLAMTCGK